MSPYDTIFKKYYKILGYYERFGKERRILIEGLRYLAMKGKSMANKLNYKYWTKRELRHCITWATRILKLRDWKIILVINEELTDCYGDIEVSSGEYEATIRVDPEGCKEDNISPLQVLLHEMIHLATLGKNSLSPGHSEFVSETFEYPMACLFLGIDP
jgi:hypothetical protein